MVHRILFEGNRATGVRVESGGEVFDVKAEQIVLSAGAMASPQILMLSGVGPADHLKEMGIPVVHELLGVGQNLRDHPLVAVVMSVKDSFLQNPNAPRTQTGIRYTAMGSPDRNDMQIMASNFSSPIGAADPFAQEGVRFTCILELADGAGEVRLSANDPDVQPDLNYRYLELPRDRERLREAVRICVRLLEHGDFGDIVEKRLEPTDEDLASDPMAVVDQRLKVHGLEGIRVADASIMPNVIRANTNSTTIMIGERAADWLK